MPLPRKARLPCNDSVHEGVKIGLLRLRVLRPFPADAITSALSGRQAVAVLDQNLAPGLGGITYQEIAAALYADDQRPALINVIGGPRRQRHF